VVRLRVEERIVVAVARIGVVVVGAVAGGVARSVGFGLVEGSSFAESHWAAVHSVVVLVKSGSCYSVSEVESCLPWAGGGADLIISKAWIYGRVRKSQHTREILLI
jgi:hypothetical protein